MHEATRITRLAPSPTGALHLGNARTFLCNWALARQRGWRIVFRIEDLDTPRIKSGADVSAVTDLHWLGMDWDSEPLYQSADLSPYVEALRLLGQKGLIYACNATRREIESAQSAPHADEHELRYPNIHRPPEPTTVEFEAALLSADEDTAWRVRIPDEWVEFTDVFAGIQSHNVQQTVGDFVVATKAGLPAYQLAVVVDDARQGVTDVVRGDDLLRSTARQILLYRMLDLSRQPRYWHLPLVIGEDGRRLAKRHGDTRIAWYRERGVPAERIIGLIAAWCGIGTLSSPKPMTPDEFLKRFDIDNMPRQNVTFRQEHHDWLLRG